MPQSVLDLRNAPDALAKRRPGRTATLVLGAVVVIIVAAAVVGAYLYFHRPPDSGAAELKNVEAKVGRHYLLPTDETPVLATVADKSQVSALFLKNAQDGDRILVYQKNRLAIVYRPSIDRIIAVGPVTYELPPQR